MALPFTELKSWKVKVHEKSGERFEISEQGSIAVLEDNILEYINLFKRLPERGLSFWVMDMDNADIENVSVDGINGIFHVMVSWNQQNQ
jgi:hypothetical protein